MSAKPFRNSKGVNKPFRSPFSTPQNNNKNTPKSDTRDTSLKVSVAKRLLFQQTSSSKKICLNVEDDNKQIDIEVKKELYQADLELIKQRIRQKEKHINDLKTILLYKEKNKAEDLENAIKKWTECCQNVLRDYQKYLQENNGQTVKMSEILSSFNINPETVCFSINDDTFY